MQLAFPKHVCGLWYDVQKKRILELLFLDHTDVSRCVENYMFRNAGFVCARDAGCEDLRFTVRNILWTLNLFVDQSFKKRILREIIRLASPHE